MWLLSTDRAELKYFNSVSDVEDGYAILSHVWQEKEQTFQEVRALASAQAISYDDTPRSRAHPKIRQFCILAEKHGYNWAWIDTCCIDKTSSAELSEAINSMYQWYERAAICYAYLYDVPNGDLSEASPLRASRWFKRGWTLQELIAPTSLLFVLNDWTVLGTRTQLVPVLEEITTIDAEVLLHRRELREVSIARRMSWAASRETTKVEDEAYCLMGIFGVNMPTLYGEGRASFYRLQEEIMKLSPDQTIFIWGRHFGLTEVITRINNCLSREVIPSDPNYPLDMQEYCLLAPSPRDFRVRDPFEPIPVVDAMEIARGARDRLSSLDSHLVKANILSPPTRPAQDGQKASEFTITAHGMRSRLPVIEVKFPERDFCFYIAVLGCRNTRTKAGMGLLLYRLPVKGDYDMYASWMVLESMGGPRRLVILSPDGNEELNNAAIPSSGPKSTAKLPKSEETYLLYFKGLYAQAEVTWDTVHILHRPLPDMAHNFGIPSGAKQRDAHFLFSKWSMTELQQYGFRPEHGRGLDEISPSQLDYSVTFYSDLKPGEAFTITLGLCRCPSEPQDSRTRDDNSPNLQVDDNYWSTASVTIHTPGPFSEPSSRYNDVQSIMNPDDTSCPVRHIAKWDNWTKQFGDEKRGVELSFNVHYKHKDDKKIPRGFLLTLYFVMDIKLSGSVYTALRPRFYSCEDPLYSSLMCCADSDKCDHIDSQLRLLHKLQTEWQ